MEKVAELKSFLETPRKIGIVSHRNPDGDAIGSSLALFHFLSRFGHDATVAVPSTFPPILKFLPGTDYILVHDKQPEEAEKMLIDADIIFCLDFNALHRIDKMGEVIAELKTPKVLVDHHLDPEDFADYVLSDITASSTSELIYDLIGYMDELEKVDELIAECLFSGILTDTGSFKYSTSPKLYRIAGELISKGIDDTELQNKLFNSQTIKQFRLLGYCITRGLDLIPDYRTGIITLTRKDHRKFYIKRGDTEGIVNYLLKIKRITFAVLLLERDGFVKLSLRSKGDFNVQEIASKYFNGGGHKNASGGISNDTLENTKKKLLEILPLYKETLELEH